MPILAPSLEAALRVAASRHDGSPIGSLATRNRELGQAWKGAAAAMDLGAEV